MSNRDFELNSYIVARNHADNMREENGISLNDASAQNWYISGYMYGLLKSDWRPDAYPTLEHEKNWLMGWEDANGDSNGTG